MGHYRYFITICTHGRRPLLNDGILVRQLTGTLKAKSDAFGFAVWAFCFMPDHAHFLLEGTSHGSDLRKFISSYKQYTAFHYNKSLTQEFYPALREEDRAKALNYSRRLESLGLHRG
jgi:putative transposase